MPTKAEMIAELEAKGTKLTGKETPAELKAMLEPGENDSDSQDDPEKEELKAKLEKLEAENAELKKGSKGAGRGGKRNEATEEAEFQKTANAMKVMLDAEPKVGVYIPLEQGEPKGTQLPVEINGHRMNVPKGVPNVQVPTSVAEIIWQSLGIYEEASAALRSPNDPSRPVRLDLQAESDRKALD